ncbi:hypothetical protein F2Q70_00026917 [Brassica cretica]|uniref:RNase H type-1 domain-containing protein n=1 Tax=Brassica cretica TaxID=69181 RepID=A0A8S9L6X1_BRACR|nr:hypothetical protein F2Q70_00026917 [Brassica cretica]
MADGVAWSFSDNRNERLYSHVAEGLVVQSAMEHAISLQLRKVIFESDSLQLVSAIVDRLLISDLHAILAGTTYWADVESSTRCWFKEKAKPNSAVKPSSSFNLCRQPAPLQYHLRRRCSVFSDFALILQTLSFSDAAYTISPDFF